MTVRVVSFSRLWPRSRRGRILVVLLGLAVAGFFGFRALCLASPQRFDTVLAPERPAPFPDRAAEWRIRIANFNVWAVPFVSEDVDARLAEIPAAIRRHTPDIICLQEVWTSGTRENLILGFGPDYAAARCDTGGMMVLSRFPILRESYTPFPFSTDLPLSEWPAKKGVTEVVVSTPAGPVRVVTAHCALDFSEESARTPQLRFLLDLLDERKEEPLLLSADLNTPPVRAGALFPDYLEILERGFTDLKPPVKTASGWDPGPPTRYRWPRKEGARGHHPDQMLVRDGASVRVEPISFSMDLDTPRTALSDHNLLIADVRLVREDER